MKKGYNNWQDVDLTETEQKQAQIISDSLKREFNAAYPECADELHLRFEKASLDISHDERRTGAWHQFAGGPAFYTLILIGGSPSKPDAPTTQFMFHMMHAFDSAGMSMSDPLEVEHNFDTPLRQKGEEILENTRQVISAMKKEFKPL